MIKYLLLLFILLPWSILSQNISSKYENIKAIKIDLLNINTYGYKAYLNDAKIYKIPKLTNGPLLRTDNILDIGIMGIGFFKIQCNNGKVYYSRNGHFLKISNNRLYKSENEYCEFILYSDNFISDSFTISNNGICYDKINNKAFAEIPIYSFQNNSIISLQNGNYYISDKKHKAIKLNLNDKDILDFESTQLYQGFLEMSNVLKNKEIQYLKTIFHNSKEADKYNSICNQLSSINHYENNQIFVDLVNELFK